jgi:hypothetical protein
VQQLSGMMASFSACGTVSKLFIDIQVLEKPRTAMKYETVEVKFSFKKKKIETAL